MKKKDIINYIMKTPENTNISILESLLDSFKNGNESSIDVATLTISIGNVTGVGRIEGSFPVIMENEGESAIGIYNFGFYPQTIKIPLYKGLTIISVDSNKKITIEGQAEYDLNTSLLSIRGDCTMTLSDE